MISNLFKNSRVKLSTRIGQYPSIYLPLVRLFKWKKDNVVTRETQLIIGGFPRSANTFAVAMLLYVQGLPIKIAHHLHVSAQVKNSIRWGMPVIDLIRVRRDTEISLSRSEENAYTLFEVLFFPYYLSHIFYPCMDR